ncbi:MAG: hypothetical protein ABJR05_13595 [Balneola sp.]
MRFFENDKKGRPPHTWYPDILHWREGDQVYCWNIAKAIGYIKARSADYSKYAQVVGFDYNYGKATFKFKSVDETGKIYLEDEDGLLVEFEFYKFIRAAKNESLVSRKVEQNQKNSENYMELMENFQHAFDELQESDNHPKRLGQLNKENS